MQITFEFPWLVDNATVHKEVKNFRELLAEDPGFKVCNLFTLDKSRLVDVSSLKYSSNQKYCL